jgi:predicted transcriptional regulator
MYCMETTTIQLKMKTKERLEDFKIDSRESMDSVIARLIKVSMDDEPLSKEDIAGIKKGLKDIEKGRIHTLASVKKELGIK